MPSRACDACAINYPDVISECRVCGNVLRYSPGPPSHDWLDRLEREAALIPIVPSHVWDERSRALEAIEPVGGPALDVHPVRDECGRWWLYVAEIRLVGYHGPLATFDRFATSEGLVELQGFDAPRKRWWIEVL